MARALRDVNLDGRTQSSVINLVEMVPMDLNACTIAVETVRVIILVTKPPEFALNARLDGQINIVTKLAMLDGTVRTVRENVDIVLRLIIVP